jgi:hypothetical protein
VTVHEVRPYRNGTFEEYVEDVVSRLIAGTRG